MDVVIRTDASNEIGTGHVMRCLTLAKELIRHGVAVTFICCNFEGNNISFLHSHGMNVKVIDIEKPKEEHDMQWLKENWKKDAEKTVAVMEDLDREIDFVIVDHYGLDSRWEITIRPHVKYVMVIDDLADRKHDCDLLVDQTFGEIGQSYLNLLPSFVRGLYGVKYAILRGQFKKLQKKVFQYNKENIKIHLFFGGIDLENNTAKFSDLILSNFPNVELKVVVGNKYKFISDLQNLKARYEHKFEWNQNVQNMAEHMQQCDLAFGAPGTATWERACIGLPSAYLAVNENQISILKELEKKKFCVYFGEALTIQREKFISKLKSFIASPDLLKEISLNSINNVDGAGAERIVYELKELIGEKNG